MKPLKLYTIEPDGLPVMHVVARSNEQAAEMFVTWEATQKPSGRSFSIAAAELDNLEHEQALQLRALLRASTEGIARYDADTGWTIDSDGWASFDTSEMEVAGVRIFQMRDLAPIEAFVLAENYDRAWEMFERHLQAHGGDPNALLWRELHLQQLEDSAKAAVQLALEVDREGLVICDAAGQWAFLMPLGDPCQSSLGAS